MVVRVTANHAVLSSFNTNAIIKPNEVYEVLESDSYGNHKLGAFLRAWVRDTMVEELI